MPDIPESLLAELSHDDPARRAQALVRLATDPSPDALACLIQSLEDQAAAVRTQALALLKTISGRDCGPDRDEWLAWWKQNAHRACQTCGKRLYDQRLYYKVKTDVTCEPRELVITDQDLAEDHGARMREICDQLASRSEQEASDEVWVRLEYYVCTPCKKSLVKAARKKRPDGGTG